MSCRLGSANAERDLLSSPSSRQMFPSGEPLDESSPLLWVRGNGDFVVDISSYSSNDRSAEDVEVGDKAGDCTISCKKEGRSGAGAWTGRWRKSGPVEYRGEGWRCPEVW